MKLTAFNTLRKIMQLTTSPQDGEALSAIRRANAILSEANVTWETVFNRLVKVESGPENESYADEDLTDEVFEAALRRSSSTFRDTVRSIYAQWQRRGAITPAQRAVIEKAAME